MSKGPVFSVHTQYLLMAGCLFLTEIIIATMVHDRYIRPVGGDFLVVIFLYCLVRGSTNFKMLPSAGGVLFFSFLIEMSQYFQLIRILGLEKVRLASVIIGTQFSWEDMAAYTAGVVLVIFVERKLVTDSRKWNTL